MGSADQLTVQLRAAMLTDVGVVREHNEDSAHVDGEHHFFVVADGMGGHAAGEVASAMAVQKVREALEQARPDIVRFSKEPDEERRKSLVKALEAAVLEAHKAVYERGIAETDKHGMGTTLDVVLIAGPEAFVAHVGDSRTYLVREGQANQITTDHTVAEVLVIEGKLSPEEALHSPLRTILVNAIGVAPDVGIEMAHIQLRVGDQLLLCSDGLHDYFPNHEELAYHLSEEEEPRELLARLIDMAKERGGHDNITGIIVDVVRCGNPASKSASLGSASSGMPTAPASSELSDGVPQEIERADTLRAAASSGGQTPSTESTASEGDGESASARRVPELPEDFSSENTVDDVETPKDPALDTTIET